MHRYNPSKWVQVVETMMRWSQLLMMAFIGAVIVAGFFGPYLISVALAATAALVFAMRRRRRPSDNTGVF